MNKIIVGISYAIALFGMLVGDVGVSIIGFMTLILGVRSGMK